MRAVPARPYSARELDGLTGALRSALVSDILDGLDLRSQCLEPGIAALDPSSAVVGYAYPTLAIEVDSVPETPYTGLLAALDGIGPDEVWLISSTTDAALWGELTSTSVHAAGARGSVCDGYIRDTRMIRSLGYPVFSRGTSPRDANGRIEIQPHPGPVEIGGVSVVAGDLVVGDEDGVVVIPARLIIEVVPQALAKDSAEALFRKAVAEGMKPSDAYRRYKVL